MKLDFPATGRNRDAILEVLRRVLPARGEVLELASGSGQHAAWFASHLPKLTWQPTDPDPRHRASIDAWRAEVAAENLRPAVDLDATEPWAVQRADAVVAINLIHIAPWSVTEALMRGARRALPRGGVLYLYGPYRVGGAHTAPSNASFDASLQARDPSWGVRDLDEVRALAGRHNLQWSETVPMPANNLSVVFHRR